jgi:hypothetical protein
MRKITQEAVQAFVSSREFKSGNTTVEFSPLGSVVLKLFGNAIARFDKFNIKTLEVRDGGHQSATTKERLNGLPGVRVNQKAGQWYLNGEEWEGNWTAVNTGA